MDIIYKGAESVVKIPYFGQQARFFKFFYDAISPYLTKYNTYAETNSGSNSNIFQFAEKGHNVIVNDAGEYSNCVASAILSDKQVDKVKEVDCEWIKNYANTYIDRASLFAGLIDLCGYNAVIPKNPSTELIEKISEYKKHLSSVKARNVKAEKIFNMDLFKYLYELKNQNIKVDVMFMDFAWPWRDGEKTEEYETSANSLSNIFTARNDKIEIWDRTNVIQNVITAVKKAKEVSRYVFLSNQSSNFPTPELLEVALLSNNLQYLERHTMLTNATNEDNLNKCDFFREYLYVIKGNLE